MPPFSRICAFLLTITGDYGTSQSLSSIQETVDIRAVSLICELCPPHAPASPALLEVKRSVAVVFGLLAVLLTVLNVILADRVASCSRDLDYLRASGAGIPEPRRGVLVTALSGFGIEGKPIEIPVVNTGKPTLLLAFSPKCGHCAENWPSWEKMISALSDKAVRLVLLNVSPYQVDQVYLARHCASGLPVLATMDRGFLKELGFGSTPQTVLIGSDGRIQNVWTGVLRPNEVDEIIRGFGQSCMGSECSGSPERSASPWEKLEQ